MLKASRLLLAAITMAVPCGAFASETIRYSYDAKGRLVKVVRSGTVNNGVTTTYAHDKADNRQRVTIIGAAH